MQYSSTVKPDADEIFLPEALFKLLCLTPFIKLPLSFSKFPLYTAFGLTPLNKFSQNQATSPPL